MVRTLPVTYMAVVKPSGRMDHVDILSFDEPNDYLPPARWLALYKNHALNNDLAIGRGIPHITGASLTSQAMNDGIRMILAIYQVALKEHDLNEPTLRHGHVFNRLNHRRRRRTFDADFLDDIQHLEKLLSIYRPGSEVSPDQPRRGLTPSP